MHGEKLEINKILVAEPEKNKPLWQIGVDNRMILKWILITSSEVVDYMYVTQVTDQSAGVVNKAMNCWVAQKARNSWLAE